MQPCPTVASCTDPFLPHLSLASPHSSAFCHVLLPCPRYSLSLVGFPFSPAVCPAYSLGFLLPPFRCSDWVAGSDVRPLRVDRQTCALCFRCSSLSCDFPFHTSLSLTLSCFLLYLLSWLTQIFSIPIFPPVSSCFPWLVHFILIP